jgi:PncC family amidohydrolase
MAVARSDREIGMSALEAVSEQVMEALRARDKTLAVAESCTGGLLSMIMADTLGASEFFHGGVVAYTKKQKECALGVPSALIASDTAVSTRVAAAMARGALAISPADIAIAITGVAGPDPDEDGNPVGKVCIAVARRDGDDVSREYLIEAIGVDGIRQAAIAQALTMTLDMLDAADDGEAKGGRSRGESTGGATART